MKPLALSVLIGAAIFAPCSALALNSGELFDACASAYSSYSIPKDKRTAQQETLSRRCTAFVQHAFYEEGFIFVGETDDPLTARLREFCPRWLKSPMAGPWVNFVHYWESAGMSWWQRWMPAEWAVSQVYRSEFPRCPEERARAGVPKGQG